MGFGWAHLEVLGYSDPQVGDVTVQATFKEVIEIIYRDYRRTIGIM